METETLNIMKDLYNAEDAIGAKTQLFLTSLSLVALLDTIGILYYKKNLVVYRCCS